MKKSLILSAFVMLFAMVAQAQTAEEIIEKYLKAIGGKEKMSALKSVKMTAKGKDSRGMEFPATIIQTADGKQKISFIFQGKEIVQPAFDGTTGWNTNFMTMKAEKMETEDAENMKRESGDFPDPFLNYAKKGYKIALEGKEKVEGTECFKIKLTKKTMLVDGKEEENVVYYFFDTENFVPLLSQTTGKKGQAKGAKIETVYSDYQEVNGIYFPFSISQKFNGQVGFTMVVEKVELDVAVDAKEFAFPEAEVKK
jgi:hypothetical protein